MQPSTPKVTVLMAAYNANDYLHQAVNSILDQSYRDFELLIVDDASTDSSFTNRKWSDDVRIRILTNSTNRGLTKSLNIGMEHARGEYIARMDADDLSHPERLKKQIAFLCDNPDYLLVGSSYRTIDASGKVTSTIIKPMDDLELRWISQTRTAIEHSSAIFRRLGKDGKPYLYNEKYQTAQDHDLWLRIMSEGKACVLQDVLLDYRVHSENVSSTLSCKQLTTIAQITLDNIQATYHLSPRDAALVECFLNTYISKPPCDRQRLIEALHGLLLLQNNFLRKHALEGKAAMSIRSRAAGQFWAMTQTPSIKPHPLDLALIALHGWQTLHPLLVRALTKARRVSAKSRSQE
jgi:glycosyltransferase involved in cell wall biosynthesis